MNAEQLKMRTKTFATQVVLFTRNLSKHPETYVIRNQILRSSTSIAANYRAACRSRSGKEWYAKISIVVEEADETEFWLELIADLQLFDVHSKEKHQALIKEANEIVRIFAKARKSFKQKQQ